MSDREYTKELKEAQEENKRLNNIITKLQEKLDDIEGVETSLRAEIHIQDKEIYDLEKQVLELEDKNLDLENRVKALTTHFPDNH